MITDIRELPPCGWCEREFVSNEFDDNTATGASAYLISHAAEQAGVPLSDETEQAAIDFLSNDHGLENERRVKAAAMFCGRKIGRGECSLWYLDTSTGQVLLKTAETH